MNHTILTTKRLRLEKIGIEHKEEIYKLLSNAKVQTFFPKTLDKKESTDFFEKIQCRYQTDGYCYWAVIRKTDNTFIGICGLLSQIIDGENETEVGYRLSDEFWNQGYGTEAAKGCIIYAKDKLKLPSIISLIQSVNKPSIRVAEKNGFKLEKETIFQELPHFVYRLLLNRNITNKDRSCERSEPRSYPVVEQARPND